MNIKYLIVVLLFVTIISSCKDEVVDNDDKKVPVVEAFDEYLYLSDIQKIIPEGANTNDSVDIAETFINNWIQDQIMLHFANDYLTDQLDEIEQKTADFKRSLMIHKFKEELVSINSDSVISQDLINQYYSSHKNEFKLTNSIIKGYFVMIPLNATDLNNFKTILKQSSVDDLDQLLNYSNSVSGFFENFTLQWTDLSEQLMKMPMAIQDETNFLNTNKYAEATDANFYYFLYITNYVTIGEIAPLEYVSSSIKQILLQTQTNQIIDQFKQQKYDEAMKQGKIVFYN